MLHVGTSGFAYDDWRGAWYPPNLARARYFEYYAERFTAVEINSTFYRIYSPQMMESLVRRAAGRVVFAVKMSELVTHHGLLTRPTTLSYAAEIEPAARAGVLGAVLPQFPQRFHWNPENRSYLDRVRRAFGSFPLVLEIRHRSWSNPGARQYLQDTGANLCLTDTPRLPGLPEPLFAMTGEIGYVRFHGRNRGQWHHQHYAGGRYDYLYSSAELEEWAEPVKQMERKAATALVFFNNHVRGQAPANAEMFLSMSGQEIRTPSYKDLFSL